MPDKVCSLDEAIVHVRAGDAVHVVTNHTRWTAGARHLVRHWWGRDPGFTLVMLSLSSLGALFFRGGLVAKVVTGYSGDVFPNFSPNPWFASAYLDGSVDIERLPLRDEVIDDLEANLIIYYSGVERAASSVLKEQAKTITENKDAAVQRMHRIKELGHETRRILLAGETDTYGEMLHEHWTNKRKLASNMAGGVIDEHYEAARNAGAIGGKLMGAGGGGFFMFYVRAADRRRVHDALAARGLRPMRFRFDFDGARIMANFHRS